MKILRDAPGIALEFKMHKNYTVLHNNGNCSHISTYISQDGIEREIAVSTAYCGTHGRMAAIGSSWELAVEGEDEYSSTVAQDWVKSFEGEGDIFEPESYAHVMEGMHSFLKLPRLDDFDDEFISVAEYD